MIIHIQQQQNLFQALAYNFDAGILSLALVISLYRSLADS